MSKKWAPATIVRALSTGPAAESGSIYAGCGLVHANERGYWWLIHLGSGHGICKIRGDFVAAKRCGAEIAEASDWTFNGVDGWKNMDPEIPRKVLSIAAKHNAIVGSGGRQSREIAAAVADRQS